MRLSSIFFALCNGVLVYNLAMVNEFTAWFNEEVQERGWTFRELARRAGVNGSTVSLVASGQRNPGLSFCVRIAGALGERPERVLRIAGLLPPLPPSVQEEDEILETVRRLSVTDRDALIRMLRGLAQGGTVWPIARQIHSASIMQTAAKKPMSREELIHDAATRLEAIVPERSQQLLLDLLHLLAERHEPERTMEPA